MIVKVGIDVVEVDRIELAMVNPRFVERILTLAEREVCTTPMRVAGRWAAKEAIAKAVDIKLTWLDVEITNDAAGAPIVRIDHPFFANDDLRVHLSISHERGIAAAVAVLEKVR